jgi:hypothetical protein
MPAASNFVQSKKRSTLESDQRRLNRRRGARHLQAGIQGGGVAFIIFPEANVAQICGSNRNLRSAGAGAGK